MNGLNSHFYMRVVWLYNTMHEMSMAIEQNPV